MPPEITPQPPQDNSAAEALLVNHDKHAKSQGSQLDTLIHQNEKNNPAPFLEMQLQKLGDIHDAIKQKDGPVADTTTVTLKGLKGDKGDAGDQGPQGPQGEQGPQGTAGVEGVQGIQGLPGDKGEKGDTGPMGPTGPTGETGAPGARGPEGKQGPKGTDASVTKEKVLELIKGEYKYDDLKGLPNLSSLSGKDDTRIFDEGTLIEANLRSMNFTGVGVTSTSDGHGNITVVITGGGVPTIYTETPTGLIDGANKTYTTAHSIASVFSFAINGQFIHPSDYSKSANTITFGTALDASLAGLPFTVIYA